MTSRVVRGPVRISAGVAVLAMVLAGCGSGGTDENAGTVAATPSKASPSPSPERVLALVDDEESADAGKEIVVDALANDSVTLEDGTDAPLLDTYEPAELTLSVDTPPSHGTATVEGTSLTYTATAGYGGEDELTYQLLVDGTPALTGTALIRITVAEPTPKPSPTPTVAPPAKPKPKPKPKPKASTEPAVYYENCDAVRAAGAAPIQRGEPGYASHLDRDNDGTGCEPWGGSSSGGSTSTGGSGGGGSDTNYANCSAVRAAGAAPIRRGDPGYGSHLDRDGDGVACE